MEKINALIEKLQELKNSGADLSALSYYAQLLQAEVLHARNRQHQQRMQSTQSNIAVIMPLQSTATESVPATTAAQTTTLPSNKLPETPISVEVKSVEIVPEVTRQPESKLPETPVPVEVKSVEIAPEVTRQPESKLPEAPAPATVPPEAEDINTRAARLNTSPTFNNITPSEDINTRAAKAQESFTSAPALPTVPKAPEPAAVHPAPPVTPAASVTEPPTPEPVRPVAAEVPPATDPVPPKPEPVHPVAAEVPPAADLVPPKPEPVVTAQPIPTLAATQPVPEKPRPATLFDNIPPTGNGNGHAATHTGELRKDLNELAANAGLSLNDRLRQQQVEVAHKLGEMPIHDLRAAIGINDKYQFIQELFRGDRDLYERSIKTINECGNLQEADYWIQREIKIIQGWEDDHHLVQHFYSLLKKRFS